MENSRNCSIDLLRILCCFLVVCIHTAPLYQSYTQLEVTEGQKYIVLGLESFVRVGMPVFFVISGMFILNKEVTSLYDFYKKRLTSIIIPFIVASILHFSLKQYINNDDFSMKGYMLALVGTTSISDHFWFVYAIIGIYIVSPVFSLLVSSLDAKKASLILKIVFAFILLNVYVSPFIKGMFLPEIGMWLLYFISGGLITKLKIKTRVYTIGFVVGYLLTIIASYINNGHFLPINLRQYDSGINMYIFAMCFAGIFWSINMKVKGVCAHFITYLSSATYMIYLLHIAVQIIVSHFIPNYWYVGSVFTYTISMSLVVMMVSFICSAVLNWALVDRITRLAIKSL